MFLTIQVKQECCIGGARNFSLSEKDHLQWKFSLIKHGIGQSLVYSIIQDIENLVGAPVLILISQSLETFSGQAEAKPKFSMQPCIEEFGVNCGPGVETLRLIIKLLVAVAKQSTNFAKAMRKPWRMMCSEKVKTT